MYSHSLVKYITHLDYLRVAEHPGASRRFAGEGFCGKLLDCFYCLSVWVAAPIALLIGENWLERVFLWPLLSAAAIILGSSFNANRPGGRGGKASCNCRYTILTKRPGSTPCGVWYPNRTNVSDFG
jgi:hypothetical protein